MSLDAADGVVDPSLKFHSMRNLYICGGANFASVGDANPTVTVAALTHRLGRHIAVDESLPGYRNGRSCNHR
jgi:choline dehydrogenase-like flavoprotein